jgi:hypothetical protein
MVQVVRMFAPMVLTDATATPDTNTAGPSNQVLARGRIRFINTSGSPVPVTAFALPSGGTEGVGNNFCPGRNLPAERESPCGRARLGLGRFHPGVRFGRDLDHGCIAGWGDFPVSPMSGVRKGDPRTAPACSARCACLRCGPAPFGTMMVTGCPRPWAPPGSCRLATTSQASFAPLHHMGMWCYCPPHG